MSGAPLRVLRIYPAANDPRHRLREAALRAEGIEVGLVLPHRYGSDWVSSPPEPGLAHWRSPLLFPNNIPLHVWDPRVLRRAIHEFHPDVVDIHEEPFFISGVEAVLAAGRVPTVMYTAQNMEKRLPAPVYPAMRLVFRRVRGFYPCSQGAADLVRRRGFKGMVSVVPIGVDPELFGFESRGDRVGFIGRLKPEKGVAHLLQFGSRLLCLGDGPMADEVRAAGGEVRRVGNVEELGRGLSEMRVLVAPSLTISHWKEQFGRMVVEAMAAGVPVVAYASGSLPEVIGDAGILVPEGDAAALARGVEQAHAERQRLIPLGRERANTRYRWEVVARQMRELYEAARDAPSAAAASLAGRTSQ